MTQGKNLTQIVEEFITAGNVELPVLDQTATRIQQMIGRGEYDPAAVERLVASDAALSGSLLRHANSSFFGGIDKVVTVRDAIVRLGVKQVAELVLLSTLKQQYQMHDATTRELAGQLWRHSVGCAIGAQWIAKKLKSNYVQEAFLGGLLHDIGKLLLLRVLDDLARTKAIKFTPSRELVLQLLANLHCEQGYLLLQHWNIPEAYADIVKSHHDEDYAESNALLSCIRLVDMACNRMGIGIDAKSDLNIAASIEAQRLRASEVMLAELEILLEDAMLLS